MRLSTVQFTALAVMAAAIAPALANEKSDASVRGTKESWFEARLKEQAPEFLTPSTHASAQAALVPSACGGLRSTNNFAGTTGPIDNASVGVTFTNLVSGLGTYLWDINLTTAIPHTNSADIDMFLTSPAGTTITITTDNGGTNDNVFNGTLWDDNVNDPVTDHVFTNNVVHTPLSPEGRLQNFRGEDPNGIWTLRIADDAAAGLGSLTSWSLDISTLASAPVSSTTNFPKVSGLAIGPNAATTTDTVLVSGVGTYLMETELTTTITHSWSSDMQITLASPGGPNVKVSTANGGSNDNVWNGTLWDVDAPTPVTDALYVNTVTQPLLSPEGAFDNWVGQDPNGTWTITIVDTATGDGGTLADFSVTTTTIPTPTPSAPSNFVGTPGAIPDNSPVVFGTTLYTAVVAGAGVYLWDLDMQTFIQHTASADLDISLTSPTGTEIVITTDNGLANVFNGTTWDDNANDAVTDHVYTANTLASPLSAEGRLQAFRGENPNGVWTLKVVDDAAGAGTVGTMTSWSLTTATLSGAISETSHAPVSQSPNLAISSAGTPLVQDTIAVAGLGTEITNLVVYLEISHTFSGDLDVTLTSPGGTTVALTTNNGAGNDNCFNGTMFDPDLAGSSAPPSDAVYANNVVETPLSPEGAVDNFTGQNPNGNWTLNVQDDANLDGGVLRRWDLTFRTCGNPPPVPYCFGDGSGTPCPCTPVPLMGDPDKGCPSAPFPGGGKLTATGLASISNDSLLMTCTTIQNGGAVVFQGTNNNGGGAGVAFGDGLRCAAGTVRRMKSHAVTTNQYLYPDPMFSDNPISQRGAVLLPGDRYYQGWYRSQLAHCDPTANYNLTNGVKITWVP